MAMPNVIQHTFIGIRDTVYRLHIYLQYYGHLLVVDVGEMSIELPIKANKSYELSIYSSLSCKTI